MTKSIRRLLLTWLGLLALLALTVVGAQLPLGALAPAVSFGIALLKAALIGWVFMRLRAEAGLVRLVGASPLLWIAILLALVALDVATR